MPEEPCALDITSVSTCSTGIPEAEFGYNRDGERLPRINLLLIVGQKSHTPVCYRVLPGSIADVRTLRKTLSVMRALDRKGLHVVMDRGFCKKDNLDDLHRRRMRFTMGVPFTMNLARIRVERHEDTIRDMDNMCLLGQDQVFGVTELEKWDGHRIYVHTFYDSVKAELERCSFERDLFLCFEELRSGSLVRRHQAMYDKYFIVKETPKRGRRVRYNKDAIAEYNTRRAGWFVIVSNATRDKWKALEEYREREAAESSFDDIKNDLDLSRLRVHSNGNMDGRIFIQFIALIIRSRIRTTLLTDKTLAVLSVAEVLDAMAAFKELSLEGHRRRYPSEATKRQRQIAACFGFELPLCV